MEKTINKLKAIDSKKQAIEIFKMVDKLEEGKELPSGMIFEHSFGTNVHAINFITNSGSFHFLSNGDRLFLNSQSSIYFDGMPIEKIDADPERKVALNNIYSDVKLAHDRASIEKNVNTPPYFFS